MPLSAPDSVSFDDPTEYDFCDFPDDNFGAKMPALCALEDDHLFADAKNLNKTLYGDVSWENVVPENVEHVVPDVTESSAPGRPFSALAYLKREPMEIDIKPKLVSASCEGSSPDEVKSAKDRARAVAMTSGRCAVKLEGELSQQEATSISSQEETIVGKKRTREEEQDDGEEDETSDNGHKSEQDAEKESTERTAEQRKKRRMEALARFRSKRANRSFTKKVRYECRKQLADSRPRVKGRFVRKIEMALYRKYGALYRDHLDELNQSVETKGPTGEEFVGDQCVPSI